MCCSLQKDAGTPLTKEEEKEDAEPEEEEEDHRSFADLVSQVPQSTRYPGLEPRALAINLAHAC